MDASIAREVVEKLEAIRTAEKQGQNVKPAIAALTKHVLETGSTGPHLNDLAKRILTSSPLGGPITLTPDSLITSDFLADKISHWVELVRKEIVGSQRAPFATFREAALWIEQGGPQEAEKMREQNAMREQVLNRGGRFTFRFRTMQYLGQDGTIRDVAIVGPKPRKWYKTIIPTYSDVGGTRRDVSEPTTRRYDSREYTELNWLDSETKMMAEVTGFTQLSLIQFVLLGIKPILSRFETWGISSEFTLPNGEELRPSTVQITIRARDMSFEELKEVYDQYRQMLQLQRGKRLTEKHRSLYQIVRDKGGPPKGKGTVAFWESIKVQWNGLYPDEAQSSWKGLKQNHERITQRLRDRFELNDLGVITTEGGSAK